MQTARFADPKITGQCSFWFSRRAKNYIFFPVRTTTMIRLLSHPQLLEVFLDNFITNDILELRAASSSVDDAVLQYAEVKVADATRDVPRDALEARRRIKTSPMACCPFSFVLLLRKALSPDQWLEVTSEVRVIDERFFSGFKQHERDLVKLLLLNPQAVEFLFTALPSIGDLGPLIAQCRQLRFLATPFMDYKKFGNMSCFGVAPKLRLLRGDTLQPSAKRGREHPTQPPSRAETTASLLSNLTNLELFDCEKGSCDSADLFTTAAASWPKIAILNISNMGIPLRC